MRAVIFTLTVAVVGFLLGVAVGADAALADCPATATAFLRTKA